MFKKIIIEMLFLLLIFSFSVFAYASDEDYIEIYNIEDLKDIAKNPNSNYILMADINMSDDNWYPIIFNGVFDGNNHILYNINIMEPNRNPSPSMDGNRIEYDTYFAGLFSKTENAVIKNLNLLNVKAHVVTVDNCFVAGLVGNAVNTEIENCSVTGKIYLYSSNKICGVAGIVGFGYGNIKNTTANVTLVLVDKNDRENCEEFLGGVVACGYPDIENCTVKLDAYASVHGYVHNGGIVGMHHIHTSDRSHVGYVRDCNVDAVISFYEDNSNRRAYCAPYVGEKLNANLKISDNTTKNYEKNEYFTYDEYLMPEMCDNPEYEKEIIAPTCTELGYSIYTCLNCGHSYTDDYTPPSHKRGPWEVIIEPTYEENGLMASYCSICGELVEETVLRRLEYVESCTLNEQEVEIAYKSSIRLSPDIQPAYADNAEVMWSSSDEEIAQVDAYGNVTALKYGTAIITCSSLDGNAESYCTVNVRYTFKQWLIMILLFGWIWY